MDNLIIKYEFFKNTNAVFEVQLSRRTAHKHNVFTLLLANRRNFTRLIPPVCGSSPWNVIRQPKFSHICSPAKTNVAQQERVSAAKFWQLMESQGRDVKVALTVANVFCFFFWNEIKPVHLIWLSTIF